MTFVQNAIDGVRRKVHMVIDEKNNGASHLDESKEASKLDSGDSLKSDEVFETVLLSDVFNEAVAKSQPKSVIIKVDIELYECRAFLASQEGKYDNSIKM